MLQFPSSHRPEAPSTASSRRRSRRRRAGPSTTRWQPRGGCRPPQDDRRVGPTRSRTKQRPRRCGTLVSEGAAVGARARAGRARRPACADARYVRRGAPDLRVREVSLTRGIRDAMSALRGMDSSDPGAARAFAVELQTLPARTRHPARDPRLMGLAPACGPHSLSRRRRCSPRSTYRTATSTNLHDDRRQQLSAHLVGVHLGAQVRHDGRRAGHAQPWPWSMPAPGSPRPPACRSPRPTAPALAVDLPRPAVLLPETVRERFQAGVVLSTRLVLGERRTARVAIRRPSPPVTDPQRSWPAACGPTTPRCGPVEAALADLRDQVACRR